MMQYVKSASVYSHLCERLLISGWKVALQWLWFCAAELPAFLLQGGVTEEQ